MSYPAHARDCAYITTDGPAACTCGAGWLINMPDRDVKTVADAIRKTWEEIEDVPFPLYDEEAIKLARAAIVATFRVTT